MSEKEEKVPGLRDKTYRQAKNADYRYFQKEFGFLSSQNNSMYKDMLKNKHLEIKDDALFLITMENLIHNQFGVKSMNNSFKYCRSCYAFVTRKMQAKHEHDQLMDFTKWHDLFWKSDSLKFLKDEAEKNNLKKKGYWYAPGFTRDPCCGNLSKIRKKPERKFKTDKVNQHNRRPKSNLKKRELCLSVFQETFWPEKKIKLDTLKSLSRCPNCNAKNKRAQKDSAEVSTDEEENFNKPIYTQAHFHN